MGVFGVLGIVFLLVLILLETSWDGFLNFWLSPGVDNRFLFGLGREMLVKRAQVRIWGVFFSGIVILLRIWVSRDLIFGLQRICWLVCMVKDFCVRFLFLGLFRPETSRERIFIAGGPFFGGDSLMNSAKKRRLMLVLFGELNRLF